MNTERFCCNFKAKTVLYKYYLFLWLSVFCSYLSRSLSSMHVGFIWKQL